MTYTPTKEELEELGFTKEHGYYLATVGPRMVGIFFNTEVHDWTLDLVPINIQSLDDLKTLIRILTPQ